MKFSFKQFIVPNFAKRLAFMLPAVILMGVFVSILVEIGWGTDPASFMNLNIASTLGWGLGNTEVLVYGLMLIFTFIFSAQMIGFGTLANMILIGYVVDLCRWIWRNIGFATFIADSSTPIRILIFAITLIFFVIVAAIYINAQMGVAPYDALPSIITDGLKKFPYFAVRIVYDFLAVVIGILAAQFNPDGIQGSIIGSIVMTIFLGPVVQLISKPLKKIL